MTQTDDILKAILLLITDADGPYDPAALFIGVFTAIDDKGSGTALSDITQATGDTATRVAVTPWSDASQMDDGRWVVQGPVATFIGDSDNTEPVVIGWFFATASTAGTLKAFGYFDDSVNLPTADQSLSIVPRITVDPDGRWSAEVVWNG